MRERGRTPEERIADKLLVLYTIADAGTGVGDTVLQKLTFLASNEMRVQGVKGFNYAYIKLDFGPYSSDLVKDVEDLEKTNAITSFSHGVGNMGHYILKHFSHVFDENPEFVKKIQRVNKKYSKIPRDELVHIVHEMRNPLRPFEKIIDTREKSYILKRPKSWSKESEFIISDQDMASLEILLNPKNLHALSKSIHDARSKPSVTLSEVLERVRN
jgi:uncharacterized protein YwgA